jgi:hypothetical protein
MELFAIKPLAFSRMEVSTASAEDSDRVPLGNLFGTTLS